MEPDEYMKLAEVEDRMWYFRCLHGRMRDAVRLALGARDRVELLDAGCGTGGLLKRLRSVEPSWRGQGVDLELLACEIARQRGNAVTQGSITELPFTDASFDAITCADVLYHISEHDVALREFHRCLKPGGVLAVNVPAYRWLWSYHDERVHSKHRFVRGEVLSLLRQAGFAPVTSTYWNTLPFPLIVVRRKILPPKDAASDVKLYSPAIEALFDGCMALERGWNRLGLPLPFGSSVFAVARKP